MGRVQELSRPQSRGIDTQGHRIRRTSIPGIWEAPWETASIVPEYPPETTAIPAEAKALPKRRATAYSTESGAQELEPKMTTFCMRFFFVFINIHQRDWPNSDQLAFDVPMIYPGVRLSYQDHDMKHIDSRYRLIIVVSLHPRFPIHGILSDIHRGERANRHSPFDATGWTGIAKPTLVWTTTNFRVVHCLLSSGHHRQDKVNSTIPDRELYRILPYNLIRE